MQIIYNLHHNNKIHNLVISKTIELKQLPSTYASFLCVDKDGGQWLCVAKRHGDTIIGYLDDTNIDTLSDIKQLLNTCKYLYLYQRDIDGYDRIYDIRGKVDNYLYL